MCQGAAISRNKSEPVSKCIRRHVSRRSRRWETSKYRKTVTHGKHQRNEPFDQHADRQRSGHDRGPQQRSRLLFVLRPQEGPESEGDHERQHHVRNNNAGEQEQPDASGDDKTGIDSGLLVDRPAAEAHHQPGKKDRRECGRDASHPVVHAKQVIEYDRHPILERGFVEIQNAVHPGRHPVARVVHIARHLRLERIHVVHERRRADDGGKENDGRDEKNHKLGVPAQHL